MIDLSVVSGTYNRIAYLQRMVDSARQSIGNFHNLKYEFVLVDGSSTDGTIEWCEDQPDIRLIKHPRLLGAIKAFNDGAFAAKGKYVILANDDIEFVEDTILKAYVYMQNNPDCGIGCLYQNRNGREWHVESMPIVIDGKQSYGPYGQVCIVPKWLGDYVEWWGRHAASLDKSSRRPGELYTYGGDNEISSRIYELGYKVSPIPETKIHDNEALDDLRKINNISGGKDPKAMAGHHPDSWAWGKKWRNEKMNLVGPVIRKDLAIANRFEKKERIVYLPIYEQGWPIQKEQKRGLREALEKVAIVAEYDYVGRNAAVGKPLMFAELQDMCTKFHPTIVLTQLHNGDIINSADVSLLRNSIPYGIFINWNGDYWRENLLSETGLQLARSFDLQTCINREVLEEYQKQGINAEYWQIGWEPDGVGHNADIFHDVVFLGSGYSQERQKFVSRLRNTNGIHFGLYGQGWPDGWAKGENLYNFKEACKVYRGAKISLGDSQWPDSGFVSNRIMQSLVAGGSALAHQWFRGIEELGLEDGKNIIIWREFSELIGKIDYYLRHEDERLRIAIEGEKLALEKHSFDERVRELFQMISVAEPTEENWRW